MRRRGGMQTSAAEEPGIQCPGLGSGAAGVLCSRGKGGQPHLPQSAADQTRR